MPLVFMIYALQLAGKIHGLNPESGLLDRRSLAIRCRAALLPIRVKTIRWPSLGSKAWQPLHFDIVQKHIIINFFEKFVKIVDDKNTIYALIYFLTFNNNESIEMLIEIRKFQNVFSFKIATILFFYNN